MTLTEYQQCVAALPFGKRLPMAVYIYRGEWFSFGEALDRLLAQVVVAFQIGSEFNVVKFRTDELKVSLLFYPRFFDDPHPALRHAITIDLVRGKARHADYGDKPRPSSIFLFDPEESAFSRLRQDHLMSQPFMRDDLHQWGSVALA